MDHAAPPHVRKHSHSLPPDGDVFPPLVLEISRLDIFLLVEAEVPVVPLQPLYNGHFVRIIDLYLNFNRHFNSMHILIASSVINEII